MIDTPNENTHTDEATTLIDVLLRHAYLQPGRLAYTFLMDGEKEEAHLTYKELDQKARAVGAVLQNLGADKERILLLYPPQLDYIAAFLGCLYAGAVAVPAYPPDPTRLQRTLPRLLSIIKDAQPLVALTTSPILSMAKLLAAQAPLLREIRWLATDTIADEIAQQWQAPDVTQDTLAMLQYTSGSTASPKGVMLSHGNLIYNSRMIQTAHNHNEQSTFVSWLPIYHDMGLIGNVLHPLCLGSRGVLMSPLAFLQKPIRWLQAVSHYQAHTSGAPNFAYDLCVRKTTPEQRAGLDLSSWRVAFNGAEPVYHRTLERFFEAFEPHGFRRDAFCPCYGLAEAALLVSGGYPTDFPVFCAVDATALEANQISITTPEQENARILVSCGRTWLEQKIVIVDPESGRRCSPNKIGEIWISGDNVGWGYWNNREATREDFQAYLADTGKGPFLRTGDLGFLREGELFITGRHKDLIIIDGLNHYPQDIERTVEQSCDVIRHGSCAAFSVDIDGAERLVIVAEVVRHYWSDRHRQSEEGQPMTQQHLSVGEITDMMGKAVSKQHNLRIHDVLLIKPGSIPKTSSGKIQRHACRTGYLTKEFVLVEE
ncbi:MAG: fatty acyl-AMP ligase [Anaerolinea sp.]|nr:fatty acyl-AMP ligase [Anaerolinea sp.]